LGATISLIAAGFGLAPDVINDIEDGTASGEMHEHHVKWLSI
jgi:hypothetical protein